MRESPFLFDLAQLLAAGLAPDAAVRRLEPRSASDGRRLDRLGADLQRGRALAPALAAAGYASKLEAAILAVGEQSGKLDEALRAVARTAERRRIRIAGLRVRLWFPNVVLAIILVIGITRAMTAGASLPAALTQAGLTALPVVALTYAIVYALSRDATGWLTFAWRSGLIDSSTLARRGFEYTFYTVCKWQTDAGVDFLSGTATLGGLIDEHRYRQAVGRYRSSLQAGRPVTESLETAGLLKSGELREVVRVGEESGRLAPALGRYLDDEETRLDRITDTVFAWLPRSCYALVLLVGGYSLM